MKELAKVFEANQEARKEELKSLQQWLQGQAGLCLSDRSQALIYLIQEHIFRRIYEIDKQKYTHCSVCGREYVFIRRDRSDREHVGMETRGCPAEHELMSRYIPTCQSEGEMVNDLFREVKLGFLFGVRLSVVLLLALWEVVSFEILHALTAKRIKRLPNAKIGPLLGKTKQGGTLDDYWFGKTEQR